MDPTESNSVNQCFSSISWWERVHERECSGPHGQAQKGLQELDSLEHAVPAQSPPSYPEEGRHTESGDVHQPPFPPAFF